MSKPSPRTIIAAIKALTVDPIPWHRRSLWDRDRTLCPVVVDEARGALIAMVDEWQWGPNGALFLSNQKWDWDGSRRLTVFVQGRVRAVIYREREGDSVYVPTGDAAEWAFVLTKSNRRAAHATYKARLALARGYVATVSRGSMRGVPPDLHFEPGQMGGRWVWTVTGLDARDGGARAAVSARSLGSALYGAQWTALRSGFDARDAALRIAAERKAERADTARRNRNCAMATAGLRPAGASDKGRRHLIAGGWWIGRAYRVGDRTPLGAVTAVAL